MTKKGVLMMGLVVLVGAAVVSAAVNPAGTVFKPWMGYTTTSNLPIIDSVTGNPVQTFFAIGDDLYATFGEQKNAVRNIASYGTDSMMTFAGGWWLGHPTKTDMNVGRPGWSTAWPGDIYWRGGLMSDLYRSYAAVWAFIAPQDGYYKLEAQMQVFSKYEILVGHPEYPGPVEAYTFTGPGHATYTNLAWWDNIGPLPIWDNLTARVVPMAQGDMFCVAVYGGSCQDGPYPPPQFTYVYLNDVQATVNTGSLVKVTVVDPPTTAAPVFSVAGGTYTTPQTVTITCATSGATIYYTTDDTIPSLTNGTSITSGGSVLISSSTILRAVAFVGTDASMETAATYTINCNPIGTSWNPVKKPQANSTLPYLDPVTGNPVQSLYVPTPPDFNIYNYPAGWFKLKDEVAATHTLSNYNEQTRMDNLSLNEYRCNTANNTWGDPGYHFGDTYKPDYSLDKHDRCRLASYPYIPLPATWVFIAPQDGYYQISGNMAVTNKTETNNPAFYGATPKPEIPALAELFSFRGPGRAYLPLQSFSNVGMPPFWDNITTATVYLTTGDMLCLAAYGGPSGDGNWSPLQSVVMMINDMDLANGATGALVTVTLVDQPATATPVFSIDSGTYAGIQAVTITCATPGATIYYTTDNTTPSLTNGTAITSGGSALIDSSKILRAVAYNGTAASAEKAAAYTIHANPIGTVFTPWMGYNSGSVVFPIIDTVTGNPVQTFFAIGSNLSATFAEQKNAVWNIASYDNASMMTFAGGWWIGHPTKTDMNVGRPGWFSYTDLPWRGQLVSDLYRSYAAVWAFIAPQDGYYKLEAQMQVVSKYEDQLLGHPEYPGPVEAYTLTGAGHATYTNLAWWDNIGHVPLWDNMTARVVPMAQGDMFCVAVYGGSCQDGPYPPPQFTYVYLNDVQATGNTGSLVKVTVVPPTTDQPILSPTTGTFTESVSVSIFGPTGATLRYTTNGTDPDNTSAEYTAPITITSTTTVKARAYLAGKDPSSVASETYTITAAKPTFSPDGGMFSAAKSVTMSCSTAGAAIRYTTDGTDPLDNSTLYTSPILVGVDNTTVKAKAFKAGLSPSATGSAMFLFPTAFNRPTAIPYGTAIFTGNPDADFAGATWAPIDQGYWGTNAPDVTSAYYTARWTPTRLYVAVKVYDTNQVFNDTCQFTEDEVELYLHTTGFSTWPACTFNDGSYADAQQYLMGPSFSDPAIAWTWIGIGSVGESIPGWVGFTAKTSVSGNWIYYEASMVPYKHLDVTGLGVGSVVSTLSDDQVIGLDAVVTSNGTGMKTENLLKWKSQDYTKFGLHVLAPRTYSTADLAAVLAAMDSKSGSPGWNANADVDGDGEVTSSDLAIVLANMP